MAAINDVRARNLSESAERSLPNAAATVSALYQPANFFVNYPVARDASRQYDMQKLMHYEWILIWRKTLFDRPAAWLPLLFSVSGLTLLALTTCPDPVINLGFCVALTPNSAWFVFTALTSFLLGFFCSNSFLRWWTVRDRLQTLQALIVNSTLLIRATQTACGKMPSANVLVRYYNLVYALALKGFRGEQIDGALLEVHMPDGGPLLTEKELEYIQASDGLQFVVVMTWISQMIMEDMPLIEGGNSKQLKDCKKDIMKLNHSIMGIMVFLEEPVPRQYVHLLCFMTRIHITFVHLYCAGLIGQAINFTPDASSVSWELMLQAYAIMIINYMLYYGMLHLGSMLKDPFGNDSVDLPLYELWKKTCTDTYQMMHTLPSFLPIASKAKGD